MIEQLANQLVQAFVPSDSAGDELMQRFRNMLTSGRDQGLTDEQVKTQVFAVSYFLRQTARDFDNAYLLEELTDELFRNDRQTCILSPIAPYHYADVERATVAGFSEHKQNMVKLLLDLAGEPNGS
jgi:hypothetical protein